MIRKGYITKLTEELRRAGLDAMLICPSEELKFFTGFRTMMCERFQGLFVKADGSMFYLCNLIYGPEIEHLSGGEFPVYTWFDGDVMTDSVRRILDEQGLLHKRIAVNSTAEAFNILEIMDKVDVTFVNGKPIMEEVRIRKTPEEMECLRQSARIADDALAETIRHIRPGMTEGEIRAILLSEMENRGGTDTECLVASGPNSAYPHYIGTSRVIGEQDLMVIDFGCAWHELRSDISRMVFVGEPTDEMRGIYALVDEAQRAAQNVAKLGAWIPDVDEAARGILRKAGYADFLPNRVGHGIGYMTHEGPDIKGSNPRRLEVGMAFSIEPGIYLPGKYGMRIENIVMINENGETEVLNKAPRELMIV